MKLGRVPQLLRELADELDALDTPAPSRRRRKPALRVVPKLDAQPTELQRARATRLLPGGGRRT